MSNVLPKDTQKEIWSFYRGRFVLVGSVAVLLGALVAFLSLLPAYMAMRVSAISSETSKSAVNTNEEKQEREDILHAHTLVTQLTPVLEKTAVFDALVKSLEARPSGVSVTGLQIKKEENRQTILINGNADRAQVSAYRDALMENSEFDAVRVPVGSLAGSEGGQFSITLEGVF